MSNEITLNADGNDPEIYYTGNDNEDAVMVNSSNGEFPMSSLDVNVFVKEGKAHKTEFVDLRDLGLSGGVYVREMDGLQRSKARRMVGSMTQTADGSSIIHTKDMDEDADHKILLWSLVTDSAGSELLFPQITHKQRQESMVHIRSLGSAVIDRIVKVSRELSGLGVDKDKDLVAEAEDNF